MDFQLWHQLGQFGRFRDGATKNPVWFYRVGEFHLEVGLRFHSSWLLPPRFEGPFWSRWRRLACERHTWLSQQWHWQCWFSRFLVARKESWKITF